MKRYLSRRKTAPKVADGRVQHKNRTAITPNYYNTPQNVPVLERQRPSHGHRHVIRKKDLIHFISILPDWKELSIGLNAVLLAPHDEEGDGWHVPGVVAVCAWPRTMWIECRNSYWEEHRAILDRLAVPWEKRSRGYLCKFAEGTVRAFQLLHVLLHELGHHHDRMTTRSKCTASRGENYAEQYAREYSDVIWSR